MSGSMCLGHGGGGLKGGKSPVSVLNSKKSEEWGHGLWFAANGFGEKDGEGGRKMKEKKNKKWKDVNHGEE